MNNEWVSRFFQRSDPRTAEVLVPLPRTWWSRFYEYRWAQNFVHPQAVVLDAASGVSHPLKFWLGAHCASTFACDIDPRIQSIDALSQELCNDLGVGDTRRFLDIYLPAVRLIQASLLNLPYPDRFFDRIFCVSVLEHLSRDEQRQTFDEFQRTLKDDGLVIVTMDYPTVNLAYLQHTAQLCGLAFAGPVNFSSPPDALISPDGRLKCFRAVLCHAEAKEALNHGDQSGGGLWHSAGSD